MAIVQEGNHEILLKSDGMYKILWNAQVGGFLRDELKDIGIKTAYDLATFDHDEIKKKFNVILAKKGRSLEQRE